MLARAAPPRGNVRLLARRLGDHPCGWHAAAGHLRCGYGSSTV